MGRVALTDAGQFNRGRKGRVISVEQPTDAA